MKATISEIKEYYDLDLEYFELDYIFMKELIIESRKQLGFELKAEREKQGLSKRETSRRSELTTWQITQIERGSWSYTVDSLLKLADVLRVKIVFEEI